MRAAKHIGIGVLLALAPPALAGVTFVPPGNSSAGEYSDIVPTSGGDQRVVTLTGQGGGRHGGPTSPSTVSKLNALGPAGRAAAQFAQRTAPAGARPGAGTGAGVRSQSHLAAESQGTSPLSAILKRVLGSSAEGGSGLLLPLTLLIAAAALAAVALLRRRQIS
jgi:hypothetical protein